MTTGRSIADSAELQQSILRAVEEQKPLLCLIKDESRDSELWDIELNGLEKTTSLTENAVIVYLQSGSREAGFLGSLVSVDSVPAIIIIHNGSVLLNVQFQDHGENFAELNQTIHKLFPRTPQSMTNHNTASHSKVSQTAPTVRYLELPTVQEDRRSSNSAYDKIRQATTTALEAGSSYDMVLRIQLRLLESLDNPIIRQYTEELKSTLKQGGIIGSIPEDVKTCLLNTSIEVKSAPEPQTYPAKASSQDDSASNTRTEISSSHTGQVNRPTSPAEFDSVDAQRKIYVSEQQASEASRKAERNRIREQTAVDHQMRREVEASTRAEIRRQELNDLRKANSTTANPQSTDIRIQVRTFDGSTIRASFSQDATIAADVRSWIDHNLNTRDSINQSKPYGLKILLTPLPSRTIEPGEEKQHLSDIEGVVSSVTMVMVPIKGYTESYVGSENAVASALDLAGSIVSTGTGIISTGLLYLGGGLARLIGLGGLQQPRPAEHDSETNSQHALESGKTSGTFRGVRVRTLADQRAEENERSKDTQFYNGNATNFQPRKDEDT